MPTKSKPSAPTASIDWAAVRARVERATLGVQGSPDAAEHRELLVRRARALAAPLVSETASKDLLRMVVFEIGSQAFGLEANCVREAVVPRESTRLPGLPPFVRGLVNVRSRLIPTFDLKPLLQLPMSAAPLDEKLLVVTFDGCEFGLLAERVIGTRELSLATLHRDVPGLNNKYLRGIAEDGLILLELSALFPDLVVNDGPAS